MSDKAMLAVVLAEERVREIFAEEMTKFVNAFLNADLLAIVQEQKNVSGTKPEPSVVDNTEAL